MRKRFLTHLWITIVVLVTGSVTLLSIGLYIYIASRLHVEFNHNMEAYKARAEIILNNRIDEIKNLLRTISIDNTVRFAAKMGKHAELADRLKYLATDNQSIFCFVRDQNNKLIAPRKPSPVQNKLIAYFSEQPRNETPFSEDDKVNLVWQFESNITDQTRIIGTVFALYNMAKDRRLIREMDRTIDGYILIAHDNGLLKLDGESLLKTDLQKLKENIANKKVWHVGQNIIVSPMAGFQHLYYALSQEGLLKEKKNMLAILMFFSISILVTSTLLSLFLGRQMSKPLGEMARMAIQISKGKKDLSFKNNDKGYMEFNQLSQAFNYMLDNLKDAQERSRFTELLENVDDAVYLTDENGKILNANEATYTQLGYTANMFFNLTLSDILPLSDARMVLELLHTRQNSMSKMMTYETALIKKNKEPIPVEIKSRVINYIGGKSILNVARDITLRKEAEKELRESEQRYRLVIETSHNGILILDRDFRILFANNRTCQILGYSQKEIRKMNFGTFLEQGDLQKIKQDNEISSHEDNIQQPVELKMIRKDRQQRYCHVNTAAIRDSSGEVRTVVQVLDITDQYQAEQEKKQLESHLRQSQKMEAIGNLAGGIAHDFNNLLQIIQGYTEILIMQKKEEDPDYKKLYEVKFATERATDLTRQLLTFSRKVESKMKPTDINQEVTQIHKLLKRTLPQMVDIEVNLSDNLFTANADASQLGQMIMNLSVNARDAMPDGGKLIIETENATLDEAFCSSSRGAGVVPGNYVVLSVTDTGHGIDSKELEHIYEPFYTTKEVGKGTGLGLSIVYGIVNNHNGHILCDSKVGEGTTFTIYLPGIENQIPLEAAEAQKNHIPGTETILLVDDDEAIRNLGHEMLSEIGHRVFTAPDGETALKLYKTNQNEIDLIMLDLMMPGMGGYKCLENLLEINPEAKVLVASGHSCNESLKNEIQSKAKGFLNKPYAIQQVSAAIRNIFDADTVSHP